MKTNILIVLIIYSLIILEQVSAQTAITIYTPRGSSLTAYNQIPEMDYEDKLDWSDYVALYYPQATEINPPSASNTYNCHGYAWHVSEGGSNKWVGLSGYDENPEDVEDIYWTDQSYILTTEAYASKISYYEDNHSAIQTSTQGIYRSKWGSGPLMQHARAYGPSGYEMDYRKYYRLNPYVIGSSDELCANSERTYSSNTAISGSTYSWTRNTSLLDYVSGAGTTNYRVKAKSGVKGNAWVRLQITTPSGEIATTPYKNFWVGKPAPTITGEQYPECDDINWYFLDPEDKWGTYYWDVTSGLTIIGSRYGYKAQIRADEEGTNTIYCDVTNDCGTDYGILPVYVDCFGFKISPNPAEDYVEISLDENIIDISNITEYEVKIYNMQQFLIYQTKTKESSFKINTSKYIPGTYSVQLIYNGKAYSQQLVISN